jgi:hypothetical protein
VSKPYEYRLRSSIRKKIQILTDIELPLLMKSDFLISSYQSDNSLGTGLETGPDDDVRTKEINTQPRTSMEERGVKSRM